jgi:DNA invertase Pin-like site-specific DNA recombinase
VGRVLGALRLSKDKDESTSIARQRDDIERWASANGHTVVGWAEDVDVSGGVTPFERPSLGPWLTSERAAEYDVIAAWKLDRLSRRLFHTFDLLKWAERHGKTVITVDDRNFDLSTPIGKALMAILAAIAEGELEAIRERSRSSVRHLMKIGRWRGGFVPYGYVPVKAEDGEGWRLEVDPDTSEMYREIVRRIVQGEATNSVVRWLNESGVPIPVDVQRIRSGNEPSGSHWRPGNLLRMLRSKTALGYAEMTETRTLPDGTTEKVTRLVRDEEGMPVVRADPLLTYSEWQELQEALDGNSRMRSGNRFGGSPLLRVAYCECGRPMYRKQGRHAIYYYCSAPSATSTPCVKGNLAIRAEEAEKAAEESFLMIFGNLEIKRRVFVKGNDNSARLADIERALRDLREDRAAGLYSGEQGTADYRKMYLDLEARRKKLNAEPVQPDHWEEVPTGQTYRERWATLETPAQRAAEYRAAGLKVVVHKEAAWRSVNPDLPEAFQTSSRIAVVLPERHKRGLLKQVAQHPTSSSA